MNHGVRVKKILKYIEGKKVLDGISFNVEPGKIMAFVGHSGSGKTTLLKTINRLIEVDSGSILLNNQSIKDMDPIELRHRAGMVFQIPSMFDGSVRKNVEFGLRLQHEYKISSRKIISSLQDAGLSKKFEKKIFSSFEWKYRKGSLKRSRSALRNRALFHRYLYKKKNKIPGGSRGMIGKKPHMRERSAGSPRQFLP